MKWKKNQNGENKKGKMSKKVELKTLSKRENKNRAIQQQGFTSLTRCVCSE